MEIVGIDSEKCTRK